MVTPKDIQEKLASYVAKGISLDVLEDWIAQETWNVHQSGSVEAQYLAYAVELLLSESSSGDLSEDALRENLSQLMRTPLISFAQGVVNASRSSNLPIPSGPVFL